MLRTRMITRCLALAILAAVFWPSSAWALSTPLQAVDFSNTTQGYIVGGDSPNGVMSWTNNGGDSWHAKVQPQRFMVGVDASANGATALPSNRDEVYGSSDLGVTWPVESPLLGRITAYYGMADLAGGRRVVVGRLASSNYIALIASSVGGAAWTIDFEGPYYTAPGGAPDPSLTRASLSAVDAVAGGNTAWAVGTNWSTTGPSGPYEALIYKTTNGGSTWTTQTVAGYVQPINCVTAVDNLTAFAGMGNRNLLRTLDGSNWGGVAIDPASSIAAVNGIDALDANHVLAVGNTSTNLGRIAWTSNGAATTPTWLWASVPSPLFGARMLDATHWIVVGDNETILRTADGGATWTGPTGPTIPAVAISAPTTEHLLDSATVSIEGTSSDGLGIGVANVEVRVQKQDGKFWNGSTWITSETWLAADVGTTADGWDTWGKVLSLPDTATVGSLTVWARATDGLGNKSALAVVSSLPGGAPSTITLSTSSKSSLGFGYAFAIGGSLRSGGAGLSGQQVILESKSTAAGASYQQVSSQMTGASGAFSFIQRPVNKTFYRVRFATANGYSASLSDRWVYAMPKTYVRTPIAPSTMSRSRYYTIYGWLKPRHTAGTYPVRIYKWRLVSGKWKSYGYSNAKAFNYSTYTKYARSIRLSSAGRWRVRAYAPADTAHAATWSSGYDYVTVR